MLATAACENAYVKPIAAAKQNSQFMWLLESGLDLLKNPMVPPVLVKIPIAPLLWLAIGGGGGESEPAWHNRASSPTQPVPSDRSLIRAHFTKLIQVLTSLRHSAPN